MQSPLTIEEINDLIEQRSPAAQEAIQQLEDFCQQDERCRTPLNVAIESRNNDAIGVLAASKDAVNFAPRVDADLHTPMKYSTNSIFLGDNVEETEKYLTKSYGPRTCWQRTPLHTACRHANVDAIVLLIANNAPLDAKDIMDLTPLDLCLQFCDSDIINRFISCCVEHKRKIPVSEQALMTTCANSPLYDQLLLHGTLDNKSKRFAFCRACALLDRGGIETLLQQGVDINRTMNEEFSPVMEVCTSRLLFLYEHPDAPRLAGQHASAQGSISAAITIDNDDILQAESLEDIEALFTSAMDDIASKQVEQTSYELSDEERHAQLAKRLELIGFLVEQGLDTGIAQKKAPLAFVEHVASMNSPEILQALVNNGFSLAPDPDYEDAELEAALSDKHFAVIDLLLQCGHKWKKLKKEYPERVQAYEDWQAQHGADPVKLQFAAPKPGKEKAQKTVKAVRKSKWTWELAGESVLMAETDPKVPAHNKPTVVRVTHNNVYGPVDRVQLFTRIGDPEKPTAFEDLDGGGEWLPLALVEELLVVDGEEVDRSSITETIYDETPWEATYECELQLAPGKQLIELKVASDMEGMTGVISDWIVDAR